MREFEAISEESQVVGPKVVSVSELSELDEVLRHGARRILLALITYDDLPRFREKAGGDEYLNYENKFKRFVEGNVVPRTYEYVVLVQAVAVRCRSRRLRRRASLVIDDAGAAVFSFRQRSISAQREKPPALRPKPS